MQSVAVGWQVYEITHRPLDLGLTGLVQFLPGILLFLVAGHVTDRFDRRKLLGLCYVGFATSSALLLYVALHQEALHKAGSVRPIFAILFLVGAVRTFQHAIEPRAFAATGPRRTFPERSGVELQHVSIRDDTRASDGRTALCDVSWASGGVRNGIGTATIAFLFTLQIKTQWKPRVREPFSIKTVFAGFHYIWEHKVVFGSISLDLFAVLLGGAVALLPVYAKEILLTGPWGLGLLRSAPGIGAATMALLLAYKPIRKRAGATMLWCVGGFGYSPWFSDFREVFHYR